MSQPHIEFQCPPQLVEHLPHPQPASRFVPEWLRQMPTHAGPAPAANESSAPAAPAPRDSHETPPAPLPTPTVKNCMPFLEAITCGYILPLPVDISFAMQADRLDVHMAGF